jgi:DNA (cytosine-5)-methyltransferase 1
MMHTSTITVTDIFCGCGGFTTGALEAGANVRFAANHWARAIETHNTNYPTVDHFLADISLANPRTFPRTTGLIASPECVNHSLAKGKRRKALMQADMFEGDPLPDEAEERSRCTMWDPLRLAAVHDYQFVVMENVVDVRYWSEWDNWVREWQALDYVLQFVFLNSQFCHPTPQSRDRLYIVATKRKNRRPDLRITPLAYCSRCGCDVPSVQSWKNPLKQHGKYGRHGQYLYRCPQCTEVVQPYYYAAANAIDWSLPSVRIGDRKRPLEPKTVERVMLGLRKFRGQVPFLTQVNKTSDRIHDLRGVFPTQTADNGLCIIRPPFLIAMNHGGGDERRVFPLERAMSTQTSREELALVAPPFTFDLNHAQMQASSVLDQPMRTQTTYDDTALVTPPFLVELRKNATARGVEEPLPTVCAGGEHHALVTPPAPFIIDHVHEYRLREITDPLSTIVAEGNHQSVVYPSWLMPSAQNGQVDAGLGEESSEIDYRDCGFRMLDPREIQAAMAFPRSYVVTGTRREAVRQLGNACTPPAIFRIMQAVLAALDG